ncbi:hypothetical protein D3C77_778860 [compost metagenome]
MLYALLADLFHKPVVNDADGFCPVVVPLFLAQLVIKLVLGRNLVITGRRDEDRFRQCDCEVWGQPRLRWDA